MSAIKLGGRRWWFGLAWTLFLVGTLATVADRLRVLALLATLLERERQASRKSFSRLVMLFPEKFAGDCSDSE